MDVKFRNRKLDRLETDPSFTMGLPDAVVRRYRQRLRFIRAARDERDFRAYRSLHFERLKGDRRGCHSMRLNDQFRLIVVVTGRHPDKYVRIEGVEDYH